MSDDDLIRRGDALNAIKPIYGWSITAAEQVWGVIAALPAVTVPQGVDDGRPCNTDVFLVAAMEQLDDKWDFFESVKDWCEGDWDGALTGIELPAPAQPALTAKPVDDSLAADPVVKPALAEALAVPEMKALVEAANEHIAFMEGTGLTFDFLGKLRAALRQIGGEA